MTLDGLVRFYFNISYIHLIVTLAAQFIRTDKKLTGKKIEEYLTKTMFQCLNDCFCLYPECVAVETSLSLNSEFPINCVLKDDNKVNENEIDFKKQNFILTLKGESFQFSVCHLNENRIRIVFLDFNQIIEINELPFGKVYSRFSIQVFDQKSQLISRGTEDSISTEMIDTRIST